MPKASTTHPNGATAISFYFTSDLSIRQSKYSSPPVRPPFRAGWHMATWVSLGRINCCRSVVILVLSPRTMKFYPRSIVEVPAKNHNLPNIRILRLPLHSLLSIHIYFHIFHTHPCLTNLTKQLSPPYLPLALGLPLLLSCLSYLRAPHSPAHRLIHLCSLCSSPTPY